jgi:hypothetical protein
VALLEVWCRHDERVEKPPNGMSGRVDCCSFSLNHNASAKAHNGV